MLSHFNSVDFGGDLFGQWPVGIRFEVGLEQVSRAVKLYEFTFGKAENCILVSQDWHSDDICAERCTPLFTTPGIFPLVPSQTQTIEIEPFDETPYRLTWARLHPLAFDATQMFQAIANRERGGLPAIGSGVYLIDPHSKIIMHMYDDRGLDVIAADAADILPLYNIFGDWILENQRHRITFRFEKVS